MEQSDHQDALAPRREDRLLSLHEIFFSLNIVSAVGFASLLFTLKNLTSGAPKNDVGYYLLRAAIRLNDLLRLSPINAVTTSAVGRQTQGRWGHVGLELTILVSVLCVSLIVLLFVRLSAATSVYHRIFNHLSLPSALFAAPICYVFVSKVTWQWQSEISPGAPHFPFWWSPLLAILVAEILCTGVLFLIHRVHPVSTQTMVLLFFFHYGLWLPVLWFTMSPWAYNPFRPFLPLTLISEIFTPHLLLIVFPLSGVIWLLHFKQSRFGSTESRTAKSAGKWIFAAAVVLVAVLAFIWLPGRAHSLTHPKDFQSVTVELSRGPCFGSCPSYKVVIHGSGLVEYVGYRNVRVRGRQIAAIDSEKLMQILQQLDRTQFFTIEDRAFAWCFDTPSVSVSVLMDGRSKGIVSDSFCTGARVQAHFVHVAQEIDGIVGSDRWVKCDGRCRN